MLMHENNPHGGDIYRNRVRYDFSANTSPLGTPPEVTEAIREAAGRIDAYPDPSCTRLIDALSVYERVQREWLICGNGAADLIFTFAAAVRSARALIVAPTFCEYENAVRAAGGTVEYFRLSPEDEFAFSEAVCDAVTSDFDTVFLCNPNNPTGTVCTGGLLERLAARCSAMGARLFIDECFCDLAGDGEELSFKSKCAQYPGVFLLKAFTKSYGMAGVRLGYGICSDSALLERMSAVSQVWNVSTLAQEAGIAALGCTEFLKENRRIIAAERKYLTDGLRGSGMKVYESAANFILFSSPTALYEGLLEQGVLIRRCGNFVGLDDRYYRCAVRTHPQNEAFLKALSAVQGVGERGK